MNHTPVQPHGSMQYMGNNPNNYGSHFGGSHFSMNDGFGNNNNNNNYGSHRNSYPQSAEFQNNQFLGQNRTPQNLGQAQMLMHTLAYKKKELAKATKAVKNYASNETKKFNR